MRPADEHLTPQELGLLLLKTADSRDSNTAGTLEPAAQRHLEGCAACQSRAEKYRKVEEALSAMRIGVSPDARKALPGPNCASEEDWLRIAAGLMDDEHAAQLLSHAAACRRCGALLKKAMEDLSEHTTAEEEEILSRLPMSSPKWQRAMAGRLAAQSRSSEMKAQESAVIPGRERAHASVQKQIHWWPRIAWATAAIAMFALAGSLIWLRTREPDVNQLLAQSYAETRTIELRIPGAEYGPLRVERGSGQRDLSPQFYIAKGIIQSKLAKHSEDPMWLQMQARAHLLEWEYEKAIRELDDALTLSPNDPKVLLDKATALYERAEKEGIHASIDYGEAAQDLSLVLAKTPHDPVARFNRSILYEKLNLLDDAIEDLNEYLRLDPKGNWAREAQERLDNLKSRIKTHQSALGEPLENEFAFIQRAKGSQGIEQLNGRIEGYQNLAIDNWLPRAFSSSPNSREREALLEALSILGTLLATRHDDFWLSDFMAADNFSSSGPATVLLSQAVRQSAAGDSKTAYVSASRATRLFESIHNVPGALRAEVESIHALQRLRNSTDCLSRSDSVEPELKQSYRWLNIQMQIDRSACLIMAGRFDQARDYSDRAVRAADQAAFPLLHLRGIGIAASIEISEGDLLAAWSEDESGLEMYWRNPYSTPIRAHQFYDDLMYAAEDLEQWNLATAFARESAQNISLAKDFYTEALDRQHLAKLAIYANNLSLAEEELQKASALLAKLPDSQEIQAYKLFSEIDLAEIDLRRGDAGRAEKRLASIRENLKDVSSFELSLSFFRVYGNVLVKQSRVEEARNAYEKAILIGEDNSRLLKDESRRYLLAQEISPIYRALIQLEIKAGFPERGLAVWEAMRAIPLLMQNSPTGLSASRSFPGIGHLLGKLHEKTLVSYAVLPEGLAIWVSDGTTVHSSFVQKDPDELVRLVRYFSDICADRTSDLRLLKQTAGRLYALFIAPIAQFLPAGTALVIENDDMLGNVPYQALWETVKGYLIATYQIIISPGLLYQRSDPAEFSFLPQSRALVVGSTIVSPQIDISTQPAPDIEREAKYVAGNFGHADLLIGVRATAPNLEKYLPSAEVFHFAGHAIANTRFEGLLLAANDGRNTELWGDVNIKPGLFRHCRLAVLAACSTGRGNRGRREVHGKLVRALLMAGASRVIASDWDIDSATTETFMQKLYAGLLSGKPALEANKLAMNELLSNEMTQHPYYWAAFSVFGAD
jgi:CHAT domain-containing protein/tetratricopeptide (TPR) repeat protein